MYCHRILVQNWIYLDRRQFRNPDLSSWREALTTVGTSSGKPAQRRDQNFFHPPEVSIGLHPRGPTTFRCEISRRVARLHRCTLSCLDPSCSRDGFRIALTRRASATGFVPDQYKHACGGPPSGVCVLLQPFPRPPLPVFCCKLGTLENPKKETQINQNELDSDRERIYGSYSVQHRSS